MLNMEKLFVTWLLLFCVSVLVKGDAAGDQKSAFKVEPSSGGAKVTCPSGLTFYKDGKEHNNSQIYYKDSNSGEYTCKDDDDIVIHQVFVKFRNCDNCIELDVVSVTGMIVGNVVATIVIGVSVYLVAKHTPGGKSTPNKKGSDKQRLVTNEVGDDEHYQRLRPRNGRDIYDKLRK